MSMLLPYRVACPPPVPPRPKLRRFVPIRGLPGWQGLLLTTSAFQLVGLWIWHGAIYGALWSCWHECTLGCW